MKTSKPINPAELLLNKLSGAKIRRDIKPLRKSLKVALLEFSDYLNKISKIYIKTDLTDSHLVHCIYKDATKIKGKANVQEYNTAQLYLANKQFKRIVSEIELHKFSNKEINKRRAIIRDFIFDVKPYIEYFVRKKDPNFVLFIGVKFYGIETLDLFNNSYYSFYKGVYKEGYIQSKMSLNTSCFLLRQCLEVHFKRLCGIEEVYYDDKPNPKIHHFFFIDLVIKHKDHFEFPGEIDLKMVSKIYNWTNRTIHHAEVPWIWELKFAHEYIMPMFLPATRVIRRKKSINVYPVYIKRFAHLKKKIVKEIRLKYGSAVKITEVSPDAMT